MTDLGLTETQAAIPIHVGGEMWTLQRVAGYLYDARREEQPNHEKVTELAAELARLRKESERIGDSEIVGATDPLETSARDILSRNR